VHRGVRLEPEVELEQAALYVALCAADFDQATLELPEDVLGLMARSLDNTLGLAVRALDDPLGLAIRGLNDPSGLAVRALDDPLGLAIRGLNDPSGLAIAQEYRCHDRQGYRQEA
jgi:hypothetical protein